MTGQITKKPLELFASFARKNETFHAKQYKKSKACEDGFGYRNYAPEFLNPLGSRREILKLEDGFGSKLLKRSLELLASFAQSFASFARKNETFHAKQYKKSKACEDGFGYRNYAPEFLNPLRSRREILKLEDGFGSKLLKRSLELFASFAQSFAREIPKRSLVVSLSNV